MGELWKRKGKAKITSKWYGGSQVLNPWTMRTKHVMSCLYAAQKRTLKGAQLGSWEKDVQAEGTTWTKLAQHKRVRHGPENNGKSPSSWWGVGGGGGGELEFNVSLAWCIQKSSPRRHSELCSDSSNLFEHKVKWEVNIYVILSPNPTAEKKS